MKKTCCFWKLCRMVFWLTIFSFLYKFLMMKVVIACFVELEKCVELLDCYC